MTALDFSRRSDRAELMDDAAVDFATFRACLVDLAKANRWTLNHRPTLGFLERLHREGRWPQGRPLRLVDVGSGYGDMIRAIDRWAARRGLDIELTGVDLSPWSAKAAASVTPAGRPIRWVTADAFVDERPADVVTSALFTHHLSDDEVVRFLRRMEATAEIGWFVNDLHRHAAPYFGFALLARVMGWHRFVRHDGPVSVARGFTVSDWRRLTGAAGLAGADAEVRWRFPFRICVSRVRA